jgi:hypothetical protein
MWHTHTHTHTVLTSETSPVILSIYRHKCVRTYVHTYMHHNTCVHACIHACIRTQNMHTYICMHTPSIFSSRGSAKKRADASYSSFLHNVCVCEISTDCNSTFSLHAYTHTYTPLIVRNAVANEHKESDFTACDAYLLYYLYVRMLVSV